MTACQRHRAPEAVQQQPAGKCVVTHQHAKKVHTNKRKVSRPMHKLLLQDFHALCNQVAERAKHDPTFPLLQPATGWYTVCVTLTAPSPHAALVGPHPIAPWFHTQSWCTWLLSAHHLQQQKSQQSRYTHVAAWDRAASYDRKPATPTQPCEK